MSCLKLHWPQALSLYCPADLDWSEADSGEDAPRILRFPQAAAGRAAPSQTLLLSRARHIYQNRCCPVCSRHSVVPVDAEPVLMTRNHMPVPGSGTLAGFECDSCGHRWGVSE